MTWHMIPRWMAELGDERVDKLVEGGHLVVYSDPQEARCLGFGEREDVCDNEAGSTHSHLWCQECDDARRAHITAQMEKISASDGAANNGPTAVSPRSES